jgi:hypothetical protein
MWPPPTSRHSGITWRHSSMAIGQRVLKTRLAAAAGSAPGPELEKDLERKGIGVLIRVDRVEEAFAGVSQRREATNTG